MGHHVGDQVIREVAKRLTDIAGDARHRGPARRRRVRRPAHRRRGTRTARARVAADLAVRLREPVVVDSVRLGRPGQRRHRARAAGRRLVRDAAQAGGHRALPGQVQPRRDPELPAGDRRLHHRAARRCSATCTARSRTTSSCSPSSRRSAPAPGDVLSVEALSRWLHPRHGLVSPDVFIPLAENSGLISRLSRWGIEQAVATLRRLAGPAATTSRWPSTSRPGCSPTSTCRSSSAEVLERHGVPATRLTVEVTESTIMADPKRALEVLGAAACDLGVSLAIDDYGTGYSSLSYLRRIEADELKIDKSFVHADGAGRQQRDHRALHDRAGAQPRARPSPPRASRTARPHETLQRLGCDRVQGFYHSRPLSARGDRGVAQRAPPDRSDDRAARRAAGRRSA